MKPMTLDQFARDCIDMFLEFRDQHGCDEETAKAKAVLEMTGPESGIELVDTVNP